MTPNAMEGVFFRPAHGEAWGTEPAGGPAGGGGLDMISGATDELHIGPTTGVGVGRSSLVPSGRRGGLLRTGGRLRVFLASYHDYQESDTEGETGWKGNDGCHG